MGSQSHEVAQADGKLRPVAYQGAARENIDYGSCGNMYFNRTLLDWANYDISNRTRFDASVSTGFALMANYSKAKRVVTKDNQINLNFARYNNKGVVSKIIS